MEKKYNYIIVSILLAAHFILGLDVISRLSPTFDETIHLTAGYSYLKTGKYFINIYDHPPLAEMFSALPLLFMKPALLTSHPRWSDYRQYPFSNLFFYYNRVDPEKMLNSARVMILLLSCLLGFMVYLWSKNLYGGIPGIFALALYVFGSNFLAHGTLVTTDLAVTLFYFLGCYSFWRWANKPGMKNAMFMGVSAGLALVSKFSAVIIFGVFALLLLYMFSAKALRVKKNTLLLQALVFLAVAASVILVVYRFNSAGLYIQGFKATFSRLGEGRSSFLAGRYSTEGWKYYFLFTFLVKTPIPVLLLLFLSFLNYKGFIYPSGLWEKNGRLNNVLLLLPAVLYFVAASFAKVQIGHRHILPVYPFLMVWVSGFVTGINKESLRKACPRVIIAALLAAWYIFSFFRIHPWHLSYFNEFIGRSGSKYLTDSNIDWGQGLKELGRWYKGSGIKGIYLAYFGTGDPHYYGIKYIPVGFMMAMAPEDRAGDDIGFLSGDRVYFAVSVTNLRSTYYDDKTVFKWLEAYKPVKIIAESIFVYDLTDSPEAIAAVKKLRWMP